MAHIHPFQKDGWQAPKDPLVRSQLERWQDYKFGLMMHWGLYSQLGIVESWALVSEHQDFQERDGMPYTDFKKMYFDLIRQFNPQAFDANLWAEAAAGAGMKYLVFTTKHHDGFSMWDTAQTAFRITGPESPFKNHPKADITREVFDAFRQQNFMIGVYFSKPDWHHPDFWWPLYATPNRNTNYDTGKHPQKWQRFCDYSYKQIEELMRRYGKVDILWLDGGWIRPSDTINDEVRSWGFDIAKWEQDINMPRIAEMARRHQPGLLMVDRTVHGPYENYRTPEQQVPQEALPFPWETCLTMTQSWGHDNNPQYKSSRQLIHTLIEVVAKGGNLLLNIGPTPQGTFEDAAYERLAEIGQWLSVNGEAIYDTRQFQIWSEGDDVRFTQDKGNSIIYTMLINWPGQELRINALPLKSIESIHMLGHQAPLKWQIRGNSLLINLPESLQNENQRPCRFAWSLKITYRP